jgi:hypothetical protein
VRLFLARRNVKRSFLQITRKLFISLVHHFIRSIKRLIPLSERRRISMSDMPGVLRYGLAHRILEVTRADASEPSLQLTQFSIVNYMTERKGRPPFILVGGSVHSGKTVFGSSLIAELFALPALHTIDVVCPDYEGSVWADPSVQDACRQSGVEVSVRHTLPDWHAIVEAQQCLLEQARVEGSGNIEGNNGRLLRVLFIDDLMDVNDYRGRPFSKLVRLASHLHIMLIVNYQLFLTSLPPDLRERADIVFQGSGSHVTIQRAQDAWCRGVTAFRNWTRREQCALWNLITSQAYRYVVLVRGGLFWCSAKHANVTEAVIHEEATGFDALVEEYVRPMYEKYFEALCVPYIPTLAKLIHGYLSPQRMLQHAVQFAQGNLLNKSTPSAEEQIIINTARNLVATGCMNDERFVALVQPAITICVALSKGARRMAASDEAATANRAAQLQASDDGSDE